VRHGIPNSTHIISIYSHFPIIQAHHFNYEGFTSPIAHSKGREGNQAYLSFEFSLLILSTLTWQKIKDSGQNFGGKGERAHLRRDYPRPLASISNRIMRPSINSIPKPPPGGCCGWGEVVNV